MHPSKFFNPKSMKESDGKPSPAQMIDADAFMKSADAAMRRAYLVAKKEAARYGLKLVVNQPRPSVRKARPARSRRVVERV